MKKSFYKQLETLQQEAVDTLLSLIEDKGSESKVGAGFNTLAIKKDDLMFNLEGGRYLMEVFTDGRNLTLADNKGYHYNWSCLEDEQYMQVTDHLIEEYSDEVEYILTDDAINGIVLNEKIQQEDLHEYYITHRESFLEKLMRWIGEDNKDKELMKDDLKELMTWKDEYILSSNSTNSYLGKHSAKFNETCEELLKLNSEL